MTKVFKASFVPWNTFVIFPKVLAMLSTIGWAPFPSSTMRSVAWFRSFWIEPEKPSDFFSASRMASPAWTILPCMFVGMPFHASFDIWSAWASVFASSEPFAIWFARPSRSCLSRTLLMPRSLRTWLTEPPLFWISPRPCTNRYIVPLASSPNDFLNSCTLMPATSAHFFSCSSLPLTAVSMLDMKRIIDEPAASAFWPVADAAAAHASIWSGDMPTTFAMPMNLFVRFMTSDSITGMLFPRRTSASPKLSYSSSVMPMTVAILPSCSEISSDCMFVAMSKFDTVWANDSRDSYAMPSCPPIASISRIWSAVVTCVVENSSAWSRRTWNSSSVALTVLRMSRYAASTSSADCIMYLPAIMAAGVSDAYMPKPN